ncbi:MAG: DUF2384 domain-containing protein [Cytophagales bacterium]|nr:DUF2384 domain-containing protein [Cytophagales bacterium]
MQGRFSAIGSISPRAALGGAQPFDFLDTFQGVQLVLGELESIEDGSFA